MNNDQPKFSLLNGILVITIIGMGAYIVMSRSSQAADSIINVGQTENSNPAEQNIIPDQGGGGGCGT